MISLVRRPYTQLFNVMLTEKREEMVGPGNEANAWYWVLVATKLIDMLWQAQAMCIYQHNVMFMYVLCYMYHKCTGL